MLPIAVAVVIILVILFFVIQYVKSIMLYHPSRNIFWSPADNGYNYVEFNIDNQSQKINGWLIKCSEDFKNMQTILICHGNSGNISNISYRSYLINKLIKLNYNICIFDYQGYGKSTGYPSEKVFYSDSLCVWNYLIKLGIPKRNIVLFGESIGSAVASYLAQKVK